MKAGEFLIDGASDAPMTIVLAHGAGAPMDSPYMERIAGGLASESVRVVRSEFPYMRARRIGRRPPPDREPVLLNFWRGVVRQFEGSALVIGGKSMGGRMASMIADEVEALGLVCLGYPFHPPGHPERTRTAHLKAMRTPTLIIQGTRDPFGKPDEVDQYELSPAISVHWVLDGDHDLKTPRASSRTQEENLREAVGTILDFMIQGLRLPRE